MVPNNAEQVSISQDYDINHDPVVQQALEYYIQGQESDYLIENQVLPAIQEILNQQKVNYPNLMIYLKNYRDDANYR